MGEYVKCVFVVPPCECGNQVEYDPGGRLLNHYRMTKTRKQIMEKAKQLGISDNPHFESTFIMCYKIAELSRVHVV